MMKSRPLSLHALRAFEAAARHGSINKASHELHVSRAAVSVHISRLERRLGTKLFERRHRRIELTDLGKGLLHAVRAGFTTIERACIQLTRLAGQERLVISVDPDFASLWLVPRLSEFYRVAPDVLVEVRAEKTTALLEDPSVSCAIQYAAADRVIEKSVRLFRSRLFPVCTKTLMDSSPLKTPEGLRRHVLLHDRSIDEWRDYFGSVGMAWPQRTGLGALFSDTSLCLDAACRGQGVAIGDDFLAANFLAEGRLVRPFGPAVLSKQAYFFFQPDDGSEAPAVIAFRQWLLKSIEHGAIGPAADDSSDHCLSRRCVT